MNSFEQPRGSSQKSLIENGVPKKDESVLDAGVDEENQRRLNKIAEKEETKAKLARIAENAVNEQVENLHIEKRPAFIRDEIARLHEEITEREKHTNGDERNWEVPVDADFYVARIKKICLEAILRKEFRKQPSMFLSLYRDELKAHIQNFLVQGNSFADLAYPEEAFGKAFDREYDPSGFLATLDRACWAYSDARAEIIKTVIDELQNSGMDISKNENVDGEHKEKTAAEAVGGQTPVREPDATSPRVIDQLPVSPPLERPVSPETAEFLRSRVIEQDFSYQDTTLSKELKQQMLDESKESASARKYADSIIQLSQQKNLETIRKTAKELVQTLNAEAARLGIPVSPYGRSNTWAMWDIAKQYYFFTHQAENNPAYEVDDPLTSESKREEIINRHLGWEAYAAFKGDAPEWTRRILSDAKFSKAIALFSKPPKQNNTLSSKDLAELGKILREAK